jgi:hypothetical protein
MCRGVANWAALLARLAAVVGGAADLLLIGYQTSAGEAA